MKSVILSALFLMAAAASLPAQNVTVIVTAQESAENMARRGVIGHCGGARGRREGVGFSSVSADQAVKNCCFWGKYKAREIGVARGSRGWFACVRYE